ncbi:hypothetical protein L1267_10990 [Pseudoalteromonas sp. OFAV1]|uniref:hypothetical protein n=1 Tax=Pseudoalteromonas sp. OFAV1 TaxID=2908892 RepID=UPI001F45939B|nr:hypothetical protein [Pseudoalteromonas sp. OFAV1]MCF2900929.1 hypothetical protein [Pseudoalteromonas sp. OFAV1]
MDLIGVLLTIIAGIYRLYYENKAYISLNEFSTTEAELYDLRIENRFSYLRYKFVLDGISYGGGNVNPVLSIKSEEQKVLSDYVTTIKAKSKGVGDKVKIFYKQNDPSINYIKEPMWALPLDGVFLVVAPILYIILR